jgi:hypothetical protein
LNIVDRKTFHAITTPGDLILISTTTGVIHPPPGKFPLQSMPA